MWYNSIVLGFITCCWYVGQVISSQAVELPDKEAIKLESKIDLPKKYTFSQICIKWTVFYNHALYFTGWPLWGTLCDKLHETHETLQLLGPSCSFETVGRYLGPD